MNRSHRPRRLVTTLLLALSTLLLLPTTAAAQQREQHGPMVVYSAEGGFTDAKEALLNSIVEQGIVLSNELHASDMLNRTAPDLGISENVYLHAATFEFCSSILSHALVARDPANMMTCPYAIGIYVLTRQPDTVHMAFRKPQGTPGSEETTDKIEKLLDQIIGGALEFL